MGLRSDTLRRHSKVRRWELPHTHMHTAFMPDPISSRDARRRLTWEAPSGAGVVTTCCYHDASGRSPTNVKRGKWDEPYSNRGNSGSVRCRVGDRRVCATSRDDPQTTTRRHLDVRQDRSQPARWYEVTAVWFQTERQNYVHAGRPLYSDPDC